MQSEHRPRNRSHTVLISATWSTCEVLKSKEKKTHTQKKKLLAPTILRHHNVAAASLSTNDSPTRAPREP